jgi:hypothetical protein
VQGDAARMLNGLTHHHRTALLAVAVTGMLAWAGNATAPAAGCAPGAADKPDLGFVDSNCDGIDGDKANAIFVAPGGADGNDGSYGHPKASMQAAIDAATTAHKDVYAAAGLYTGKVAFLYNNANIGLYGGYDAQTWQRSPANVTTIEAPGQVIGIAIPGVLLQLLTVHSTPGGMNSTGVRAWGKATVALSRVTVQAANGLKGADGAAAPPAPAAAPDGDPGIASTGGCPSHGGEGGRAADVNWGGTGGAAWNFDYVVKGDNGMDDGDANPTVIGGWGGQYGGQNGGVGSAGTNGSPGLGGSAELTRADIFYQAMPGTDGTGGTRGAGGGGGAGSADDPCTVGGGGGAGGRPGTVGGKGGQGGGGSLGVFAGAGAHALVLDGSVIHTGDGGKGGSGATGQPGGPGGTGGKGASQFRNGHFYSSGGGGNGGYGGFAGQGGGGAGGASIGVLTINARMFMTGNSSVTTGSGGAGGYGANNGKPGVALAAASVTRAGGSEPPVGDFDGDGVADDADGCPIAAGTNKGCPVDPPAGPVAGDPSANAPATTPGAGGSGTDPVAVSVLPASSCVSKRVFRIRINARKAHIQTARLTLDGRRLKLVKGKTRWTAKVDLRHSTLARHTLTIRGTLRSGKRFKQTRHYRTCP